MMSTYSLVMRQVILTGAVYSIQTSFSTLAAGGVSYFTERKWKKSMVANLVTEAVEIILIRILNNPPLDFSTRLTLRTISIALVSLGYISSKPRNRDGRAVINGIFAGAVFNIAVEVLKVVYSENPSYAIDKIGFASTTHHFLKALRI